jgi:hypothetical protein
MHQPLYQNLDVNHNDLEYLSHDSNEQDEIDDLNVIEN